MIPSARSGTVNPFAALQGQQAKRNQVIENSGRHAIDEITCESTGSGHFLQSAPAMFEMPFVQRPQIYYGHYVDGSQLNTSSLPSITGGVFKWVQDYRGFFLGAQVYYVVTGLAQIVVEHHFTFSGTAIKDVSPDLLDK